MLSPDTHLWRRSNQCCQLGWLSAQLSWFWSRKVYNTWRALSIIIPSHLNGSCLVGTCSQEKLKQDADIWGGFQSCSCALLTDTERQCVHRKQRFWIVRFELSFRQFHTVYNILKSSFIFKGKNLKACALMGDVKSLSLWLLLELSSFTEKKIIWKAKLS